LSNILKNTETILSKKQSLAWFFTVGMESGTIEMRDYYKRINIKIILTKVDVVSIIYAQK